MTYVNNKTFVGRLTRMAGKRDVMTSQHYPSNVIPIFCCYLYVKSQHKGCLTTDYAPFLLRRICRK